MTDNPQRFATRAIHAGQEADPATRATVTPIYQTSTFTQEGLHKHKGYEYARTSNPTRTALESCIASLENGRFGLAFASGMAAETAVMNLASAGDHVVVTEDLYGGTYRLFEKVFKRYGVEFSYIDARDLNKVRESIRPNTRLVWIETPTNPLLQLVDILAVKETIGDIPLIVDNTFASPALQNPLNLKANVVVHSTTKYLGGHSDLIGGAVVTSDESIYETVKFHQNAMGAVPSPFDAWLTLRGIKTLAVRMGAHCENATAVARFLSDHPRVQKVHYPGLPIHPQHELAKWQMTGFGGMLSFEVAGGLEGAEKVISRLNVFAFAESLGGVESLIGHPASMSHYAVPPEERRRRGISDGLLRLSVGIEDSGDLIRDLDQALRD